MLLKKRLKCLLGTGLLSLGLIFAAPMTAAAGAAGSAATGPAAVGPASEEVGGSQENTIREVSEAEIDQYFDHTVLVGDSIMLGMRNYAMRRQDTYLSRIQFLAAGSFSVNHALLPITEKNIQPMYQGMKRPVWESLSMMGAKRVFICLGMNDLNISGLEGTIEKYKTLGARIKERSPEIEIHIISMTYTLAGKGVGKLKNDTIRQYNALLQQMAEENGWGYLDMAAPLSDANGDLAAVYCSDRFVHQTPAAYDVWNQQLRVYARRCLEVTPAVY